MVSFKGLCSSYSSTLSSSDGSAKPPQGEESFGVGKAEDGMFNVVGR
jgi:hypothetical protein